MTRFLLIRHGESKANLNRHLVGGRTNYAELSPLGAQQARRLGQYVRRHYDNLGTVFASPAVRAQHTAMLAFPDREALIIDDLQELSQGQAEGQMRAEWYTPEALADLQRLGREFKFADGESTRDCGERILAALGRISNQLPEDRLHLVVSHETAILSAIAHAYDYPQQWIYETRLPNASITEVTVDSVSGNLKYQEIGIDAQI